MRRRLASVLSDKRQKRRWSLHELSPRRGSTTIGPTRRNHDLPWKGDGIPQASLAFSDLVLFAAIPTAYERCENECSC